ncbi:alpha/beta fold hydrolase [Streptomyces sp. DHE7-1]|nr:alpha/beta fold hydrolase [Streptomyces sp. DHE7-1]
MSKERLGVVMVHGIRSGPTVWDPLCHLIEQDESLAFVKPLRFEYATGLRRVHPLRVFPTIDTVADSLKEYLETEAGEFSRLILVTHSQGGLVAQRLLARSLGDGAGHRLARIRRLIMLACPNEGSEILLSLRRFTFGGRHPQERELRPLNEQVTATRRVVLRDIVYASTVSERTCPIPVSVYAGESDKVVPVAAVRSVFPEAAALPGDHSTILKARNADHRTFTTLRRLFVTVDDSRLREVSQLTPDPAHNADESSGSRGSVANTFNGGQAFGLLIQGGTVNVSPPASPSPPAPLKDLGDWKRDAAVNVGRLFGITEAVEQLGGQLANPDGDWVISVFGSGGAGKTTLAYHAVSTWGERAGFERIAWVSAKFVHLRQDGTVEERERRRLDWRELLVDIAERLRLEVSLNPAVIEDELPQGLRRLALAGHPCLIIIDNLETVPEAELVLRYIEERGIVRPHKVVLTTRKSAEPLSDLVRQKAWDGLDEISAQDLVGYLAQARGLDLGPEDIDRVVRLGESKPLLLELTISLATRWRRPVNEIESRLRSRADDIGNSVQSYLYEALLADLRKEVGDKVEANLMSVFCCRSSDHSFSDEDFERLSLIKDRETFLHARSLACDLSLVRPLQGNRQFTVHPTLREYICGDSTTPAT